jgi:hypothetical protein
VVFNANDCQPHPSGIDYLKRTYPEIDLALLPYSGGSGYPGCYANLTEQEKLSERDRILRQRINGFIYNAKQVNAKRVVPFADQFVVGGSRSHLNRYISHGSCPGVVADQARDAGMEAQLLLLNSGQSFDLETEVVDPPQPYRYFTEEDRETYTAEHLSGYLYDHEKVSFGPTVPIERLLAQARTRLWQTQSRRNSFMGTRLVIDCNDSQRRFEIDLSRESVIETAMAQAPQEPYLRVAGSDTLIAMLLIGHISWNIADAALFLDYERRPNVYDPSLYVLLNFLKV